MSNAQLETAIEAAWEARDSVTPETTGETREAIEDTLNALDSGSLRVARTASGRRLACEPVGQKGRASGLPHQGHGTAGGGRRAAAGGTRSTANSLAGGTISGRRRVSRRAQAAWCANRPISRRAWC